MTTPVRWWPAGVHPRRGHVDCYEARVGDVVAVALWSPRGWHAATFRGRERPRGDDTLYPTAEAAMRAAEALATVKDPPR